MQPVKLTLHSGMQHTFRSILKEIRTDMMRLGGGTSLFDFLWAILTNRCFRPVFTMRLCQTLKQNGHHGLWISARILHGLAAHAAGMDFPWDTKIGRGLRITHGWGTVISSGVIIGDNVTIFHGVTIGRKDTIAPDGIRIVHYPEIGDEVWIGPHAVIVGRFRIGRGARIAPGTIVTGDVPPFAVAGGNPMRMIKENSPVDVMFPAILD